VCIVWILVDVLGVGKTCLLLRYTDNLFNDNFVSTIGVDFKIKTMKLDDKVMKLQIWDTAGQERFRTITSSYYRGSDGILMVYDVTDAVSFNNIQQWLREIEEYMKEELPQFLLVGNKADETSKRNVLTTEGETLARALQCPFFETSAKNSTNVDEIFCELARCLRDKFIQTGITPEPDPEIVPISEPVEYQSFCGC